MWSNCGPTDPLLVGGAIVDACKRCGLPTRIDYSPVRIELKKSEAKWDLLWTHDLQKIASPQFANFLKDNATTKFEKVPVSQNGFCLIEPIEVVALDHAHSHSRGDGQCPACGQFQDQVAGTTPLFVLDKCVDANGIYRTDARLGSGDRKGAIIVVGPELKRKIVERGFSGVYFHEVVSM